MKNETNLDAEDIDVLDEQELIIVNEEEEEDPDEDPIEIGEKKMMISCDNFESKIENSILLFCI